MLTIEPGLWYCRPVVVSICVPFAIVKMLVLVSSEPPFSKYTASTGAGGV